MGVAITTVSSRGQIVVPAGLRRDLKLEKGSKLLIYSKDKTLVVKKISEPVLAKDFEEIVGPVRARAKAVRLPKGAVARAVSDYRSEKR